MKYGFDVYFKISVATFFVCILMSFLYPCIKNPLVETFDMEFYQRIFKVLESLLSWSDYYFLHLGQ